MKWMTRGLTAIALLATVSGVAGCSPAGADPAKLEGDWVLESFGAVSSLAPVPDVTTTLTLKDGTAEGNGGVNSYSGPYEAAPGELKFGEITATLIAGPEPAATQESRFFDALEKTERFEFDGEKLVLSDEGNNTLVVLVPK